MSESARSILHEVMEQQTLSIAKAGIICTLNARTSVLAAANPIESQWNKSKTIIENIQLPPTLLSRFDLIFLLLDPQDEAYDRRLAQHLASWYQFGKEGESAHDAMVILSFLLAQEGKKRFYDCFVRMRIYFGTIFPMHEHLSILY